MMAIKSDVIQNVQSLINYYSKYTKHDQVGSTFSDCLALAVRYKSP